MTAGTTVGSRSRNLTLIRWLTFLMFTMFAMTTDSVGVIIPQVIREFRLSMTAAGAFHYVTMSAIALAGISLGFLADQFGRKKTIILGLVGCPGDLVTTYDCQSPMSVWEAMEHCGN